MSTDIQEQTRLLREVRLALQENNYPLAIRSLEQIIELARQRGDVGATGRHLGNLALTYYRLGDPQKALTYFQQALDCARQDNDRFTEDGLLGNMGNIYREIRQYKEAITCLNEALVIAQEIGDTRGRGIWLSNLGLVYDDLRQPDLSVGFHSQAVEIARNLHDQTNLATRLANLGNSYIMLGKYGQALVPFSETVTLVEQSGKPQELALRLGILGNIHAQIGRELMPDASAYEHFKQSLDYYQRTIEIARQLDDHVSEAELLRSIATVLWQMNDAENAEKYLRVSHQLFDALGLSDKAAEIARIIAQITPESSH